MSMQHAQYVLLFLVLAVNSDWFQIYGVTHSYALLTVCYQKLDVGRPRAMAMQEGMKPYCDTRSTKFKKD